MNTFQQKLWVTDIVTREAATHASMTTLPCKYPYPWSVLSLPQLCIDDFEA